MREAHLFRQPDRSGASLDPIVAVLAIVSSMIGTTLAKQVLEAMSDQQYRRWANGIITRSPATM
jgi:hypothetical protein